MGLYLGSVILVLSVDGAFCPKNFLCTTITYWLVPVSSSRCRQINCAPCTLNFFVTYGYPSRKVQPWKSLTTIQTHLHKSTYEEHRRKTRNGHEARKVVHSGLINIMIANFHSSRNALIFVDCFPSPRALSNIKALKMNDINIVCITHW